jgi:hypothetical protein
VQEQTPRRHPLDPFDGEIAVEQGDGDREPHPERVDRARALEQQRLVQRQARPAEQPSDPLAPRLGYLRS